MSAFSSRPVLRLVEPGEPPTAEELCSAAKCERLHPVELARRLLCAAAVEEPEPVARSLEQLAASLPRRPSRGAVS